MLLTHKVGDTELERPFKKHPFLQFMNLLREDCSKLVS